MNNIRIFIRTFRTNINIKYNRMKKLNLTLCWLFVAVFAFTTALCTTVATSSR